LDSIDKITNIRQLFENTDMKVKHSTWECEKRLEANRQINRQLTFCIFSS